MKVAFLAGLPRSGSTLLCNLLAQHPDITTTPSSPLCHLIQTLRRTWSDDHFLLSQLDHDFDNTYTRLERSMRAFIEAWSESGTALVIDKNRGWLSFVESLRALYPDFKMIVTLRDLRSVYASIEQRHRQTLLLDFPDHMEHNIVDSRADALFANQGVVGSTLKALNNLSDVPDIQQHLFFARFEDIVQNPTQAMAILTEWLDLPKHEYDFENIEQLTHESDSYYRMKYLHNVKREIKAPEIAPISPRISQEITNRFEWYYQRYYPNLNDPANQQNEPESEEQISEIEKRIAKEIEEAI